MKKRWAILQHTLSKDSLEGLHFDLLLEDEGFCRAWRLARIPLIDGPLVEAIGISAHKLYWLEREESPVSGDRGWAKRIVLGYFHGSLPSDNKDSLSIEIQSTLLRGRLELRNNLCKISTSP